MKLAIIGVGQCGNRIADEFARLNKRARRYRGIEIITAAIAVNTDTADLSGIRTIKADYQHRILIGIEKSRGHGAAKLSEVGAELAREDGDKVIDALRSTKRFQETDAFLVTGGTGGGTGSGGMPVIAQQIKERYGDRPVYSLAILPFEHEEETEERTIYNTALCLKAARSVSDAVFLADNQRFVGKDLSLSSNISRINEMIVEPFYNLLCSGEEKKAKYVGTKLIDSGDIIQTLYGWTAIGYGKTMLSLIRLPFERTRNFRKKGVEILVYGDTGGKSNLHILTEQLSQRGIQQLLIEGGPSVLASFMKENLADEIIVYMTPKILGACGTDNIAQPLAELAQAMHLHHVDVKTFDSDTRLSGLTAGAIRTIGIDQG